MKEYYQKVCLFLASFSVANLIIEFSFLVFLLSHFSLAGCLCIFEGWQVICFLPCWGGENLNCDKQRLSCLWHLKNRKWSSWSSMLNGRWGWCANAMQKKLAHHMLLPIIRVHTQNAPVSSNTIIQEYILGVCRMVYWCCIPTEQNLAMRAFSPKYVAWCI